MILLGSEGFLHGLELGDKFIPGGDPEIIVIAAAAVVGGKNILLPENWTEMSLDSRREYLDDKEAQLDGFVERNQVTISEIWCECFGNQIKQLRKQDSYDISGILKRLGWASTGKRKRVPLYGQQRTFERVEDKSLETPES